MQGDQALFWQLFCTIEISLRHHYLDEVEIRLACCHSSWQFTPYIVQYSRNLYRPLTTKPYFQPACFQICPWLVEIARICIYIEYVYKMERSLQMCKGKPQCNCWTTGQPVFMAHCNHQSFKIYCWKDARILNDDLHLFWKVVIAKAWRSEHWYPIANCELAGLDLLGVLDTTGGLLRYGPIRPQNCEREQMR